MAGVAVLTPKPIGDFVPAMTEVDDVHFIALDDQQQAYINEQMGKFNDEDNALLQQIAVNKKKELKRFLFEKKSKTHYTKFDHIRKLLQGIITYTTSENIRSTRTQLGIPSPEGVDGEWQAVLEGNAFGVVQNVNFRCLSDTGAVLQLCSDLEDSGLWAHGCSEQNAVNIWRDGINPTMGGPMLDFSHNGGFYIANNFEMAFDYAYDTTYNENIGRAEEDKMYAALMFFRPQPMGQDPDNYFGLGPDGLMVANDDWFQAVRFFRSGQDVTSARSQLYYTGDRAEFLRTRAFLHGPHSSIITDEDAEDDSEVQGLTALNDDIPLSPHDTVVQICIKRPAAAEHLQACLETVILFPLFPED